MATSTYRLAKPCPPAHQAADLAIGTKVPPAEPDRPGHAHGWGACASRGARGIRPVGTFGGSSAGLPTLCGLGFPRCAGGDQTDVPGDSDD